jgi:DNA-directed RNA polymerase subunit RPC12/RpoP
MNDIGRPPGEPPDEIDLEWKDSDDGHCASCGRDVAEALAINITQQLHELSPIDDECPHCGCDVAVQFEVTVKVTDFETQVTVLFREDPNDYLADR